MAAVSPHNKFSLMKIIPTKTVIGKTMGQAIAWPNTDLIEFKIKNLFCNKEFFIIGLS